MFYAGILMLNIIVMNKISNKGSSFSGHESVVFDPLRAFHDELQRLFNNSHPFSNNFFHNIRSYNSSLSFASFNANLHNF